jgi:hypothetical protein
MPLTDLGWERLSDPTVELAACDAIRGEDGRVVAHSVGPRRTHPNRCGKLARWKHVGALTYYGCTDCLLDSLADKIVSLEARLGRKEEDLHSGSRD